MEQVIIHRVVCPCLAPHRSTKVTDLKFTINRKRTFLGSRWLMKFPKRRSKKRGKKRIHVMIEYKVALCLLLLISRLMFAALIHRSDML